jgi:hypothetical protein
MTLALVSNSWGGIMTEPASLRGLKNGVRFSQGVREMRHKENYSKQLHSDKQGNKRKGSIQMFYDATSQRFILASAAGIRALDDSVTWRDKSVSKDRVLIGGERIKMNGNFLQVIMPISPSTVGAKCGKIIVKGKIWRVHLKLVEEKTNLKGASETQANEMPGPGTLQKGVGGNMEKKVMKGERENAKK